MTRCQKQVSNRQTYAERIHIQKLANEQSSANEVIVQAIVPTFNWEAEGKYNELKTSD